MDELDFNISTDFLVPALNISDDIINTTGYINSYINCPDLTDILIINPVYILYNTEDLDMQMEYVHHMLTYNKNFVFEQRLDNRHTLFCFKFPASMKEDYNLIIEGKYSETNQIYKDQFNSYDHEVQLNVLYKNQEMKELLERRIGMKLEENCEIWDKMDILNETLFISSYRDLKIIG